MDTSAPFSRPQAPTTPSAAPTPMFTPIPRLLSQSWERVQKHLLQLFLLDVMLFVPLIGLVIVMIGVLFITGFFSPITGNTAYTATAGLILLVEMVIGMILLIAGSLALQIATIVLLSRDQLIIPLLQLFKASFKRVLPLLGLSLLTCLIVSGGFILLIIPGILFGIMLSLAPYYLVLDNISVVEAMRKSVYVSSKMFGALFIRMAALIGVSIVVSILVNVLQSAAGNLSFLVSLASFVFNIIFGWISIGYFILIFQDAKRNFGEGKGKLSWMVIVALIGWIIIVVGGYFIYKSLPDKTSTINPLTLPALPSPTPLPSLSSTSSARIASPSPTAKPVVSAKPSAKPAATPKTSTATSSANR